MNVYTLIALVLFSFTVHSQKEVPVTSSLEKATVFFQGAQLQHKASASLKPGKQWVVVEKLTDFLDPNTIQVKATGELTILSVFLRKNYEDKRISNVELKELNDKLEKLKIQDKNLRDEFEILQTDKNILKQNSILRGNEKGVVVSELKEAYTFIHARMVEISKRETEIQRLLEDLNKQMNKISQEIDVQRSRPVLNYSEIVVEVDVKEATNASFYFNYITPNASWKPYYDMRSNGVGLPIQLEAKALVNQTTGIAWKEIDLVLSTNDPYQNSNERILEPWYISYNNYPVQQYTQSRTLPNYDYSGQKIRGEVIDATTGESMPFAKIYFSGQVNKSVMTNFEGKFEITVPKGERYLNANFAGYQQSQVYINSPYIKFFLSPNGIDLSEVNMNDGNYYDAPKVNEGMVYASDISGDASYYTNSTVESISLEEIVVTEKDQRATKKGRKNDSKATYTTNAYAQNAQVAVIQKDLRVEYQIQSKFSLESDGFDQRVSISTYDLPSSYEYHSVPKIDPSVYLVANVSGWEKLNLLSGESNIYFDGTYIGKSYIDVNSTKDTLTFSMGKDSKIQALRTKIVEKSKSKISGSRQKFEIAWEIKIKNNGGAEIPLLIKDQFPVSTQEDIKVKRGEVTEGMVDENTGIITWNVKLSKNQSKSLVFDYSVDYKNGMVIYLE